MTEEDTFLRLKRIPFEEMRSICSEYSRKLYKAGKTWSNDLDTEIFNQYGWTHDDYAFEYQRRTYRSHQKIL